MVLFLKMKWLAFQYLSETLKINVKIKNYPFIYAILSIVVEWIVDYEGRC